MNRILTFVLLTAGLFGSSIAAASGPMGSWATIPASGGPALAEGAAIYDPGSDRMLVFGGSLVTGPNDQLSALTWQLSLGASPQWTNLNIFGPSARKGCVGILDPVRNRMIVFGGYDANYQSDVWALPLSGSPAWSLLAPVGGQPAPRLFAAAVYDALRDRMLIFGGLGSNGVPFNDVWAFNLTTRAWTALGTTGVPPSGRYGSCAIYDPVVDRLVVFGGSSGGGEAWSLSLGTPQPTWTQLSGGPSARVYPAAIYDGNSHRMIVFGGNDGAFRNDTWELSLDGTPTWSLLSPTGSAPAGRELTQTVFQTPQRRMVVFGGYNGSTLTDAAALAWPVSNGPIVTSVAPHSGQPGDPVTINGDQLTNVTAVAFNGTPATFTIASTSVINTTVPPGATSGPIELDSPQGNALTTFSFVVGLRPVLASISPDHAKARASVVLHGANFTGTVAVQFGTSPGTPYFHVDADTEITAGVDSLASTGAVRVTNGIGTTTSSFTFTLIPPDTVPHIVSVRDAPNDQGGKVFVSWLPSDLDVPSYRYITGYRVWRRIPPASAFVGPGVLRPGAIMRPGADGALTDFWEALATLPASYLEGYGYTAATTQDSLPGSNPYTAFFVQALTSDPYVFYNSPVDSGYSVDNLSPPTPQPFVGVYGPASVALHWLPSAAPDLAGYRLYRGDDAAFVPGPDNLVSTLTDTGYVDSGHVGSSYKLMAFDVHGNVSRYALVTPNAPTGTLISLVSADASGGDVKLMWFASGNGGLSARLERMAPGGAWQALANLLADGAGYLRYDDRDVVVGGRYGYRLVALDGGSETTFAETWVEIVPPGLALAVRNPVRGAALELDATLTGEAPARVEVLDIAGRRLAAVQLGLPGAGVHHVSLPLFARSGVVLVRLTEGAHTQVRRAVIAR